MAEFKLLLTTLNEAQNHDDFITIWLGSCSYLPNELTNFNDYLKTYDSFKTCDKYIKKIQGEHKILLVLTSFFDRLSYFNDLPQIHSIYILEKSSQTMKYKKEEYPKLVNIFTDEHTLIERLRQDILLTYRSDLPINISCLKEMRIEQCITSLDKTSLMFIWNQLFIYYLVNSSDIDMDQLKKDMIKQCKIEYQNNEVQLGNIDYFGNNCTPSNVLEYYTKDVFVYDLVNRSFRTRNIDLICKFRFFIILLYNKLKELWMQQQEENCTTVYRGQRMKINDLQNLINSKGNLVSTNTIMSTTRNRNVALLYISENGVNLKEDEVNVIFEISIENATDYIIYPFANISQFSKIPDEEEILFFAGAVVRIDSVEPDDNSTWIIKSILHNQTVEQIRQLTNSFDEIIAFAAGYHDLSMKTDDISLINKYHRWLTNGRFSFIDILKFIPYINDFCSLIDNTGNYKKNIETYEKLLSEKTLIDESKFIVLNIIIGNNYFRLEQYNDALDHYGISFSLLDEKHRLTGAVYNHIGDVWRAMKNRRYALSCYKEAVIILTSRCIGDDINAVICRKIINIFTEENNYDDVIVYEYLGNDIEEFCRQKLGWVDDETLLKYNRNQSFIQSDRQLLENAQKLYTDGLDLIKKGHFSQGLDKLLEAEDLFKKNLSLYDPVIVTLTRLYENAAFAYFCLKQYFDALCMWKKAVDIRTSFC